MDNWIFPGLIAGGVLVLVLAGFGFLMLAGTVFYVRRRGKGPSPMARAEAMAGLGYTEVKEGTWSKKIQGTSMTFEDLKEGGRWTVTLPRYNTMTLHMVEAASDVEVDGPFESGVEALDQRFRLGSSLAARIVPLLKQPKLQRALLGMPNLALQLSADELIIEDPHRSGLAALGGPSVDAELELHTIAATIVNTLFSVLYTETGTVFDEYR